MNKVKNEPVVALTGLLVAAVNVAAAYGLIGVDQKASLVALIGAAAPIILSLVARALVTPTRKLQKPKDAAPAPQTAAAPDATDADAPDSEPQAGGPDEQDASAPMLTVSPSVTTPYVVQPVQQQPEPDPVKAAMKSAIEQARVDANARNDARARAAVDAINGTA